MLVYFSLLVSIIGLIAYFAATNPKVQEVGRIAYAFGLLVFLWNFQHVVSVLR